MAKTMYVECDNAYLGYSIYRIVRGTKRLLVSEPIDGGELRFYRPPELTDGMALVRYPKSSRSPAVSYTLKLKED